jgi:hypothetical protein
LVRNIDQTLSKFSSGDEGEEEPAPEEEKPEGPEKRYKIGKILIDEAQLNLSMNFQDGNQASARLPKIEILPGEDPLTMGELMKVVIVRLIKEGAKSPGQMGKLMGGMVANTGIGAVKQAGKLVGQGGKKATEAVKKAGEEMKKVGKGLKGLLRRESD